MRGAYPAQGKEGIIAMTHNNKRTILFFLIFIKVIVGLIIASESTNPNVAEAHGIAMRLQHNGTVAVLHYTGEAHVWRSAANLRIVLHEHSVEEHRNTRTIQIGSVFLKHGGCIDNVIDIPFTGLADGAHEGSGLLIDGGSHAIGIGFLAIVINDLQLIDALEVHTAVSARLLFATRGTGHIPLQMELETAKLLFSAYTACFSDHGHHAMMHVPSGSLALHVLPSREVLAIEQYDGIRRCRIGHDAAGRYGIWAW